MTLNVERVMQSMNLNGCRKGRCANAIPASLSEQQLCLDHFLDEAFARTDEALSRCKTGRPIDTKGLEWLLADALTIVNNLDEDATDRSAGQRDRMLELLLILANLHEHVAHASMQSVRPA